MPKLSVLIPSLTCRHKRLNKLLYDLANSFNNDGSIEIVVFVDNKQISIGHKLNRLIQEAQGEYICFLADDDSYSDNFLSVIQDVLRKHSPDVFTFDIKCYFNGRFSKPTIHSIRYDSWFETNDGYFRNVGQQNIIRASIAKKFLFADTSSGEDLKWAEELQESGLLKTELYVKDIRYNYNFDLSISMSHGRGNDNNQDIEWEIKDLSNFNFIRNME